MSGNIGMLGKDYAGYFPVGDVDALRALRAQREHCASDANFLLRRNTACAGRAKLFLPESERNALVAFIKNLLPR